MRVLVFFLRGSDLFRTLNFELRTFSPARDHARTNPMVGNGRFASAPASFPPARRARAKLQWHRQNNSVRGGNAPAARTRLLTLETPAIDKVARPKLRYVALRSPEILLL